MKTYELTYIISPEISSEEAEAFGKELETFIQSKEGVILRQSNPSAKTLSYPIKGHASGFMGILEFQTEPEKLIEIKEKFSKDGKITRYIVIIKKALKPKKERRTKKETIPVFEKENEVKLDAEKPISAKSPTGKEKVELKDIEQKLDEILGE